MRILITGASGMLGCTLSPFLAARGHTVIRHGCSTAADVSCDLTDRSATNAMMEAIEPDIVVNLVAATNVDECERNPHVAYLLNVRTVENIVAALARQNRGFLIQVSTDQLYDSFGDSAEDDVRLTNIYALSKYAGELAALRMPAAVLRTNFFGLSRHSVRRSFSDWLYDNFRQRAAFTAFTDVLITPLSMDTLSAAIHRVVQRPITGIFNVGSHEGMSKADFAAALALVFDLPTDGMRRGVLQDVALAAYRPKGMCMNTSKFEQTFGLALPRLKEEIQRLRTDGNAASHADARN